MPNCRLLASARMGGPSLLALPKAFGRYRLALPRIGLIYQIVLTIDVFRWGYDLESHGVFASENAAVIFRKKIIAKLWLNR